MMENKRYTLEGESDEICQVAYNGDYMGTDEVVDRLNELTVQNNKLKYDLRECMENGECTLCTEINEELENENTRLIEENKMLKNHIKRNTISRITVEDVLDCAINDRFVDNTEIIQAINCIAKDLGIDLL